MTEWYESLPQTWDQTWDVLAASLANPAHPARFPVLATMGTHGPEARILALREVDRSAATVALYTDAATPKVAELRAQPRASLLFWVPALQFQVRLRVTITVETGETLGALWQGMGASQQGNYGVTPVPGTPIDGGEGFQRIPSFDRFARLAARVEAVDTVSLAEPTHHRALFDRKDGFTGQWLAP